MPYQVYFGLLLIVFLVFSVKYSWWRRTISFSRPRILMYHMITPHLHGSRYNKLRVPPMEFERQLKWLTESGWKFEFISNLLLNKDDKQHKIVYLTFDDGYKNNLTHALPIIQKYNAKATLFLVADRSINPDWPALRKSSKSQTDLSFEPRLDDSQVIQMLSSGLFEIQSHSLDHSDFTKLDPIDTKANLLKSKQLIFDKFGVQCSAFCYPFGLYKQDDPHIVKECGYSMAFTTKEAIVDFHTENNFEIPRIKVSGKETLYSFKLRMRTGKRGL